METEFRKVDNQQNNKTFENRKNMKAKEEKLLKLKMGQEFEIEGYNPKRVATVQLEDGSFAIRKKFEYSDVNCECAAFIVSDVMNFDLVPPVVLRTEQGQQISLQEYIPEAQAFYEVETADYDADFYKVWLFDNVIRNGDRWEENMLFKDQKALSIDHESAFYTIEEGYDYFRSYYDQECPQEVQAIFSRFMSNPAIETQMRQDLSGLLSDEQVEETVNRIRRIGQTLQEKGKISSPEDFLQ